MKKFAGLIVSLVLLFSLSISIIAQENDMPTEDPVFEISIRRVLDPEQFATLNAEIMEILAGANGFVGTREYSTFFGIPAIEEGEIFAVSISEWESLAAYEASRPLLENPTIAAYSETIENIQHVVIQPFVKGEDLHLDDLAIPGAVLELAIRDISGYEDQIDFFRTIRGFTHQLTSLDGVVREFEWLSVDGQHFVGMTHYESLETFMAASQNEGLLNHPVTAAVFMQYPPIIAQMTIAGE